MLPTYEGLGTHKKLINLRCDHAFESGSDGIYTYTHRDNFVSSNNLIKCGFELFSPPDSWLYSPMGLPTKHKKFDKNFLYWIKEFDVKA